MPIIPRYPLRRPAERASKQPRMTAGMQHRLRSTSGGRTFRLFSSVCCPCKCKGKPFCSKARHVEAARQIHNEKEKTFPTWKGGGGPLDYYFMGLDTGLQNPPSFLPPPLPLTSLVVIFRLDSLLPTLHPLPSVRVLLRATADDSFETRKRKEGRDGKPCRRKGSRHCMFMVLITKVQLVGDLYGCAFKLCI